MYDCEGNDILISGKLDWYIMLEYIFEIIVWDNKEELDLEKFFYDVDIGEVGVI